MDIAILGNGGEVPNILEIIDTIPDYHCVGIFDDNSATHGNTIAGIKVLGPITEALKHNDYALVLGIGSPHNRFLRLSIVFQHQLNPKRFVTLIHPRATVSASAQLQPGVIIQAGAVINCNVKIGANSYISPNCVIGHDTTLGPGNILAAGVLLAGRIEAGAANYFGMGASIRHEQKLGNGNLIGMGSVLVKDVKDGETVVGIPGKIMRQETLPEAFKDWYRFSTTRLEID